MRSFEPLGTMPVADACRGIILELEEGDGISKHVCLEEVRARTERDDVDMRAILVGMRLASERLMDAGTPGVFAVRGSGWQRMKPADVVAYMRARDRREKRQAKRKFRAVDVVPDVSVLDWKDRETVRVVSDARRQALELQARRGQKKRPMGELGEAS